MTFRTLMAILLTLALAATVAACGQTGDNDSGGAASSNVEQQTGTEAQLAGGDEAAQQGLTGAEGEDAAAGEDQGDSGVVAEPGDGQQQQPVIASGGDEPLPASSEEEPVRPTQPLGVQRFSNIDEAVEAMPFTLLEPKTLPENSSLSIVQIIEPVEGETEPGLPATRLIYDIDLQGVIVLYISPATGEPGTGEPTTIGPYEGWSEVVGAAGDEMTILLWEQDGTRIEMRGRSIGLEDLMAAAESLGPVGQ
ncbi:MAG: hypothetical protein ACK2T6_10035 [Anaerolineae bacterium]